MTVRIAGIEVDIAGRNLVKDLDGRPSRTAGAVGRTGPRANALWDLALIGNRGVEQDRIFEIILSSIHDENRNIRYWAVEGLATSPRTPRSRRCSTPSRRSAADDSRACRMRPRAVRMFSARQRMTAVPVLLDFAQDGAIQGDTRKWVFQALRDITGQDLPQDGARWRDWYAAHAKK